MGLGDEQVFFKYTRDWVHGRVKHKKPFPTLAHTVGSEEDTGDEEDEELNPESEAEPEPELAKW